MYTKRLAPFIAALFALAPGAAAAEPLRLDGAYRFQTDARQNGRPVCSETWSFSGETLTVTSGQEIVRKRFRLEPWGGLSVLVSETLETNGAPDCAGRASSGPAPGECRTLLVAFNDGAISTCPAPAGEPSRTIVGGCYGTLRPAPGG